MKVDDLLDAARDATGLEDFGDDSFRAGLEILVRSLRDEAQLNDVGQLAVPYMVVQLLSQRLQIEDWYRRHPEIDEEPIEAPLIGLGLPRTGSTALSNLLAEDPNARSLRQWESSQPCPPPATVEGPDPRIAEAERAHRERRERAPRMAALVPSTPTGPAECQDMMALDFKAHYFQAFAYLPSYSRWLLDADLESTYAYERRVLKLLQWGAPHRPWRLKCPSHLLFLDDLDRAFPDARYVMTHRDPAEVIASVADLYAEVGHQFSDDLDLDYIGALNLEHWSVGMARLVSFRDEGADDRFYDMDFRAMQSDPISEVAALYQWLDEPVTPRFEKGMRRWWREHAQNREQAVHPDLAHFGLAEVEVRSAFADYTSRMTRWTSGI